MFWFDKDLINIKIKFGQNLKKGKDLYVYIFF
jgi:hypothetical protein